jgi:hypothetical protein
MAIMSSNGKKDKRDLKKPTHFSKTLHISIEVRCCGLTLDLDRLGKCHWKEER